MELDIDSGLFKYEKQEKGKIKERWYHIHVEIERGVNALRESFIKRIELPEAEREIMFDFIKMPLSSLRNENYKEMILYPALAIINNSFLWLPSFSIIDIEGAQLNLQYNYDVISHTNEPNKLSPEEINAFVIAQSIIQYIDNIESDTATDSIPKNTSTSFLKKVLLLKKLGFFTLEKVDAIQSSTELGKLLKILLGGNEDSLRRMAANAREDKSNIKPAYDINRPDINILLTETLQKELPSLNLL